MTSPGPAPRLSAPLRLAFAPLHKRAFGMAVGVAAALLMGALTIVHLLRSPLEPYPLELLNEYFYGYDVSWRGAVVGMLWAGLTAFVFGWFLAFVRNLSLAIMVFVSRARADLAATREFLDHV